MNVGRNTQSTLRHAPRTPVVMVLVVSIVSSLAPHAMAQLQLVQTFCEPVGSNYVFHFSFASSPATELPVCQINAVPGAAEWFPLQCITPADWTCSPGDVTTFMSANDSEACIAPGEIQAGFRFELAAIFCCLTFAYRSSDGTPVGEEEYCFDCTGLGIERSTWGRAKQLYR